MIGGDPQRYERAAQHSGYLGFAGVLHDDVKGSIRAVFESFLKKLVISKLDNHEDVRIFCLVWYSTFQKREYQLQTLVCVLFASVFA